MNLFRSLKLALLIDFNYALNARPLYKQVKPANHPKPFLIANRARRNQTPEHWKLNTLIKAGVLSPNAAMIKTRAKEDALFLSVYLRWLECWMGSACVLHVQRNILAGFSAYHLVCVNLLATRMSYQTVGASVHNLGIWQKAPDCLYSAMLLQEPALALTWLQFKIKRMPLQAHRKFFRLLSLYFAGFTKGPTPLISGVFFYVVGKISVTGNAMSRAQFIKAGPGSPANMKRQTATSFTLINTVTGCLGLSLTFYY